MDGKKWFKKSVSFSVPAEQDSEKAAYSQLLQASDDGLSSSSSSSSSSDDDGILHAEKTKHRRPLNRLLSLLSRAIPLLCAAWGLIFLASWTLSNLGLSSSAPASLAAVPSPPPPVAPAVSCSCGGTTVAEAKARGCKFTPLAIAWLPPQCLDEELADEFDRAGPEGGWRYWADLNATVPLTRDEVGMLADTEGAVFYTTQEWHVMHCMYTWRKHYRSQFTGVTIEARSNGIAHIKHCEGIVRDRAPLQKIWTMAGIELNADLH